MEKPVLPKKAPAKSTTTPEENDSDTSGTADEPTSAVDAAIAEAELLMGKEEHFSSDVVTYRHAYCRNFTVGPFTFRNNLLTIPVADNEEWLASYKGLLRRDQAAIHVVRNVPPSRNANVGVVRGATQAPKAKTGRAM